MTHDTFERSHPVCPHCGHEMDSDEMYSRRCCDLFAIAPNEDRVAIDCPACARPFWVQGGYRPIYTSAASEDDL